MALINCPECSKEISDKAASCPNCGNPISPTKQTTKSQADFDAEFDRERKQTKVVAKEGCFLQTMNVGCMILFGIIGLIIFIIILGAMAG